MVQSRGWTDTERIWTRSEWAHSEWTKTKKKHNWLSIRNFGFLTKKILQLIYQITKHKLFNKIKQFIDIREKRKHTKRKHLHANICFDSTVSVESTTRRLSKLSTLWTCSECKKKHRFSIVNTQKQKETQTLFLTVQSRSEPKKKNAFCIINHSEFCAFV